MMLWSKFGMSYRTLAVDVEEVDGFDTVSFRERKEIVEGDLTTSPLCLGVVGLNAGDFGPSILALFFLVGVNVYPRSRINIIT